MRMLPSQRFIRHDENGPASIYSKLECILRRDLPANTWIYDPEISPHFIREIGIITKQKLKG